MCAAVLQDKNNNLLRVPSRDDTQAKLDLRSVAASKISPGQFYTVADRFETQVDAFSDRDFIVYGDRRYTYKYVDELSSKYANVFIERGLKPGDVCAMAMENRPEFFFCWLGLAKIGAVAAFLNYNLRGKPLEHVLHSTSAKAVLIGEECLDGFLETESTEQYPRWLVADSEKPVDRSMLPNSIDQHFDVSVDRASVQRPAQQLRAGIKAEDEMLYIFTSGTTGLPKAARYSHMRWMTSGDVMKVTLDVSPEDVFYCCLPLYHGAAATSVTSTALASGASIVIRRKFSSSQFWNEIRQNNVTVFQYIGEICRYLLNSPESTNDRQHKLRCMLGAGLSKEVWGRWVSRFGDIQVFEGWGSTEANTATLNVDNRIGSCGRVPYWNKTNLRLLKYDMENQSHLKNEHGHYIHCEPGEVGEAVGMIINHPEIGAGRFEGYTSAADTEKKILRNVFAEGDAWWSSGDLLRYDEDGYCYFVDRIGDTFRWKSENVSTLEVADALGDFPGMELINIYGVLVPDHEGRAGMASILMQPGQMFDAKAFYDFAQQRLPHYAIPVFVRVSAVADMTTTFKLRKVDLQRQGYSLEFIQDPLYVKDDQAGCYVPLSADSLAKVGLPAFCGAS